MSRPNTSCAAVATLRNADDIAQIVLANLGGTPVLLRDVAHVQLGPDERRGITNARVRRRRHCAAA